MKTFAPILFLSILLTTGCVQESVDGTTHRFTFEAWVWAGAFLGGLAAMPLGYALLGRVRRLGVGLLIGGPLLAVLIAPGLFMDHVEVRPDGFSLRIGMWFSPKTHAVSFEGVTRVTVHKYTTRGRKGRKNKSVELLFDREKGPGQRVPVGDLMKNGPLEKILEFARARNIPVAMADDT